MRVTGTFDSWLLCHHIPMKIYDFRMKLMMAVIKAVLRHQGINNVNVLLPSDGTFDWTWTNQKEWPGICASGAMQSPIDIDTGRAEEVAYMAVNFRFHPAKDATVKFNGHENEVYGDFGKFVHKLEIGNRNYMIYKINFKFKSEHQIMGSQHDGEIQVSAMSNDGSYGVFSFFMDQDYEEKATWNQFIDSLKTEKWEFRDDYDGNLSQKPSAKKKTKEQQEIDEIKGEGNPDLDLLIVNKNEKGVEYKFANIFRRSFYWYTGSTTTPPCKEGIFRFVFEMPIYVPSPQFSDLRDKTFISSINIGGNHRHAYHQQARKVYSHIDNGKKCADVPDVPFSDDPVDANKDDHYVPELDLSGIRPTFIKASNIATTYGYTGMNLPDLEMLSKGSSGGGRQTIDLYQTKPEDVPTIVKAKLLKKSNEIIKGINNKDKHIQELLEKPESIKVPYFD